MEIWKTIEGYEVSSHGRVRSGDRILKPQIQSRGYLQVTINGSKRTVHSLVLEAFVGPRPKGYEGSHLDGDNSNNNVNNLAWMTSSENNMLNTRVRRKLGQKLTLEDAREIRSLYATGEYTNADLGKTFNVTPGYISMIVTNIRWTE